MNYVDEKGNKYALTYRFGVWYVWMYGQEARRFKEIPGSKDQGKVAIRLNAYALAHNLIVYPDVICSDCAQRAGKCMVVGHIATYYPAICGICGELVTCTKPRDYNHWNSVEELKALYRAYNEGRFNPCKTCKQECTEIHQPNAKDWLEKRRQCRRETIVT